MEDSIEKLTKAICAFRDARDWKKFHNPKEMAVAIAAEAGELLQHFVWQSATQSQDRVNDRQSDIASEMADIAILLFEMASNCDIDLATAIRAKLARNDERYPVEKAKGSSKKDNGLWSSRRPTAEGRGTRENTRDALRTNTRNSIPPKIPKRLPRSSPREKHRQAPMCQSWSPRFSISFPPSQERRLWIAPWDMADTLEES